MSPINIIPNITPSAPWKPDNNGGLPQWLIITLSVIGVIGVSFASYKIYNFATERKAKKLDYDIKKIDYEEKKNRSKHKKK